MIRLADGSFSCPTPVKEHSSEGQDFYNNESQFSAMCDEVSADDTIEKLSLCDTRLQWSQVKPLCEILNQCQNITELDLSDNKLGNFDGVSYLAEYFKKAPTPIRTLNIGNNDINEEGMLQLLEALVEHDSLASLTLDSNKGFTAVSTHGVGNLLVNTENLTELSLNDLQMDDDGCHVIAESTMHNKTLTSLSMAINAFDWEAGTHLGEMLTVNKTLQNLDLSFNRMRAEGLSAMLCSEAIAHNKTLTSLNFANNFVNGIDHIAGLPEALRSLNLNTQNINVPGACKLSKYLENEKSALQRLYLVHNLIGNDGVCVLCDALNGNTVLRILDLTDNMIGIDGCMYLSAMLCTNTTLQRVHMGLNNIGAAGWSLLENSIEQMWGLSYLEVKHCGLGKHGETRVRQGKLLVDYGSESEPDTESDEESSSSDED